MARIIQEVESSIERKNVDAFSLSVVHTKLALLPVQASIIMLLFRLPRARPCLASSTTRRSSMIHDENTGG
jgi:hypothetical protein